MSDQKRDGATTNNQTDEIDEVNQDETDEGFLTPKRVKENEKEDKEEGYGSNSA